MGETGKKGNKRIYTLGHSTLPLEVFIALLRRHGIQTVVDVRSQPRSRRHPQFNLENLAERLPAVGMTYHHLKELGGKNRTGLSQSPNTGLPREWRPYADYLLGAEADRGLTRLLALADLGKVALVCAEADWRQCHRQFLSDCLLVRGFQVWHLHAELEPQEHRLRPGAEIRQNRVTYPAAGEQLPLF
ncbi:MAG: DUF488 domain-containing protein [candidate division FCPU426 bacterium]